MNKLLKRALMLGTLVVCLATAAWAGNVEMSWVGGNVDCSVNLAAEGYYQNSYQYCYYTPAYSHDGEIIANDYYFDVNGNMTWGRSGNGVQTYRNDYDKNGRLIRSVVDGMDTIIDTFTYDQNGLLTASCRQEIVKGYKLSRTYSYTYGNNQITVKESCEDPEYGNSTSTYVYTLDHNGNVVKCVYDYGEETFIYDARGNLTEKQFPDGGKYLFEYNAQDLCVKELYVNEKGNGTAATYEYDEHGNVVKKVQGSNVIKNTYAPIPQGGSQSVFADVSANTYYNAPVIWATETGITKGKSETVFAPNEGCTRAQMVTFLWRAAGSPEPNSNNNPFTDVKQGAYYKAILWAVEKGITKGTTATTFDPNVTCTRAQIVTFIYRAAGEPAVQNSTNPFQDVKQGAYYKAILWAVENGITNGFNATTFSPNATCTRAQGVTFLYRGIGLY